MLEGKTRKERVDWRTDEVEKLARLVIQMRINHPISSGQALTQKAIEQLPKDRRRKLQSLKQVPRLVEEMRRQMRVMSELAEKGSLPPPPPPSPPTTTTTTPSSHCGGDCGDVDYGAAFGRCLWSCPWRPGRTEAPAGVD